MPQIEEISLSGTTQLIGALRDGLEQLDVNQEVLFEEYTRVVLPIDGFVFWAPQHSVKFKGSLHYLQETSQEEDETYGRAQAIFTAEAKIVEFETAPINRIYVASIAQPLQTGSASMGLRFAFARQHGYYDQSRLWHYSGSAISPALQTQLLDTPNVIDLSQAVTSNSLALWLALNSYVNPFYDGFNIGITLYPSFITPPNLLPPYAAVHIGDDDTRALQAAPYLDANRNHYQLASDRVRITLYGLQNNAALDFLDFVEQYSVNTDNFGIMNTPIVRDGIRTQAELVARAMKKVIDFEISYYQQRVANVARQLILSATPAVIISNTI